jgi:hypothetical protein
MFRPLLLTLATIAIGGCSPSSTLPGGYTISYGDRGKAWLKNPDGTIAHAGLIKRLYRDEKRILLVAHPVSYGGEAAPPYPLDENCYVALLVDASTQRMRQIHLAKADHLAARMSEVESYERPCLKGMPNTPS